MSESPTARTDRELLGKQMSAGNEAVPSDLEVLGAWQSVFDQTKEGLRAFLRHRLRQESDVDDCLQAVYVKIIESSARVSPAARRAWLFRVAANEAARFWREQSSQERALTKIGSLQTDWNEHVDRVVQDEVLQRVSQSIQKLPIAWRQVLRLRIHENLTFQEIAQQLDIPLGTALTQMRRALERLRSEMRDELS
jgi:RNA polymerase sigma-70 factor (ECF subfamily)